MYISNDALLNAGSILIATITIGYWWYQFNKSKPIPHETIRRKQRRRRIKR